MAVQITVPPKIENISKPSTEPQKRNVHIVLSPKMRAGVRANNLLDRWIIHALHQMRKKGSDDEPIGASYDPIGEDTASAAGRYQIQSGPIDAPGV